MHMTNSTKDRLVTAAAQLLDQGGQEAVTLRAVAERVGVSHNAPYKHFRDRNALLAGVARADFEDLGRAFTASAEEEPDGIAALRRALRCYVDYALAHPSRYRLLFSDPNLQADEAFREAATGPFRIVVQMVATCQQAGLLPAGDAIAFGGLIFATAHGAIDLQIGGRASAEKGLGSIQATMDLMLGLLTSSR